MPGITRPRRALCSLLIFCIWLCAADAIAAGPGNPAWVTGQILVQPRVGVTATRLQEILARHKAHTTRKIQAIGVHVVAVPAQAEEAVARALANNPRISFAEVDRIVELAEFIPDDPHFEDAWHLQTMNMPTAWDIVRGEGVIVAVLDTGVHAQHDDLSGQLVTGWNSADGGMDTSDINGHGTKVAGVIGAVINNALGVASIAPGALIMPVRVSNLSSGNTSTSAIASGLTWATDNGARVANISYAVTSSWTIGNAAQYMRNAGGVVVVSAGNSGTDPGLNEVASIITVSATTSADVKAGWSTYGNFIDVAAPGNGLWTTSKDNNYSTASGTSFSSPATAATAALVMEAKPGLSPGVIESILEDSAVDLGTAGWDPLYGHGRIDAAAAVLLARGGSTTDIVPPAVAITAPLNNATVTDMVPVDVSASDNIGVSRVELHVDGLLLSTDDTEPYAFSWDSSGRVQGQQAVLTAYAYDAAGNSAAATVVVWIADTSAPLVTAPPPVTTEATGALTSVELGTASAFDNVDGNVPVAASPGGPFSVGQHTVIWSASDTAGNTGSANQQVMVTDTTPPAITPPVGITASATGPLTSVSLGEAVALDLVDGDVTATPSTRGPFPPGPSIVTWNATDAAGNTSAATQTVTVIDVTAPVITPPPDATSEASGPLTDVDPGMAQAVDNVDGAVAVSASTNGPFPVGISEIIWSATDASGNSASAKQRITITDTTAPVVIPPPDITVGATGELTQVDLGDATATDLVSGTLTPVADSGGPFASGVHAISWTATDAVGNTGSATQVLTILPQVSLTEDQTVNEGSSVFIGVILSGPAAAYPVEIPFTIGGSAMYPDDHTAVDGVITISAGTHGRLEFYVNEDGISDEAPETVVVELLEPINAVLGTRRMHTVTIIENTDTEEMHDPVLMHLPWLPLLLE